MYPKQTWKLTGNSNTIFAFIWSLRPKIAVIYSGFTRSFNQQIPQKSSNPFFQYFGHLKVTKFYTYLFKLMGSETFRPKINGFLEVRGTHANGASEMNFAKLIFQDLCIDLFDVSNDALIL